MLYPVVYWICLYLHGYVVRNHGLMGDGLVYPGFGNS